jgi:hypothetical protein
MIQSAAKLVITSKWQFPDEIRIKPEDILEKYIGYSRSVDVDPTYIRVPPSPPQPRGAEVHYRFA